MFNDKHLSVQNDSLSDNIYITNPEVVLLCFVIISWQRLLTAGHFKAVFLFVYVCYTYLQ